MGWCSGIFLAGEASVHGLHGWWAKIHILHRKDIYLRLDVVQN